MLGIVYLIICICTGELFCGFFFPTLKNACEISTEKRNISIPRFFVLFPAWYLTGTLFVTWITYFVAYAFGKNKTPLTPANAIVMPAFAALLIVFLLIKIIKKKISVKRDDVLSFFGIDTPGYLIFFLIVLCFTCIIMYKSFNVKDDTMNVGYSVWGDFGAHLSMIRSFSYNNNYPTGYTYFAGEDIKYHFMHEFLVGNLEYLGLRIDHAFNIPSIISLVSVYLLLFALTVNVLKSRLTAVIGALFFTFRSSPSAFIFMAKDNTGHPIKALFENTSYFNYSEYHESWGFWCTRVFCNQRHLAFGITALLLALILFLPYLKKMGEELNIVSEKLKEKKIALRNGENTKESDEKVNVLSYVKTCFFTKEAFGIHDWKLATGAGLFLGALAFWHGSALIATLSMLFLMAAFSCFRLDYLITACLSVVMAVLQSKIFITGSAVSPQIYYGFIAEERTPFGVLRYIIMLTGITLFLAVFGALKKKGVSRYMLIVYFAPFVMSFFLSLTPDIGVNHKWVIISLMLLSMYTAYFVAEIFKAKDIFSWIVGIGLVICLTITGVAELSIQANEDQNYMMFDQKDPVTLWLKENVSGDEIILTDDYALSNIVLSGSMSYFAYEYCTWSAGYDTSGRKEKVIEMMNSEDSSELAYLTYKNGIDYIVVNIGMRQCGYYDFNEELLENTFTEVFTYGDVVSNELKEEGVPDYSIRIFDTRKPIYEK